MQIAYFWDVIVSKIVKWWGYLYNVSHSKEWCYSAIFFFENFEPWQQAAFRQACFFKKRLDTDSGRQVVVDYKDWLDWLVGWGRGGGNRHPVPSFISCQGRGISFEGFSRPCHGMLLASIYVPFIQIRPVVHPSMLTFFCVYKSSQC